MKIIKVFSDNVVTSIGTFFHYIHHAISEKIDAIRKRWIMLTFQGSKAEGWIKAHETNPRIVIQFSSASSRDFIQEKNPLFNEILSICILRKKYDLIPAAVAAFNNQYTIHKGIDCPLYHFLLDKTYISNADVHWGKNPVHLFALILAETLQKLTRDCELDKSMTIEESEAIKEIFPKLIKSLGLCAYISKDTFTISGCLTEPVFKEIISVISDFDRDFPVLIPSGCDVHSAKFCVDTDDALTVYNSGFGLESNHAKLNDRYQTYKTIEQVPREDLVDAKVWEPIIKMKNFKDMSPFYNLFQQLGKRGKASSTSHPGTYEQPQLNLTCATQGLMAFLRHQIMRRTQGSDLKKFGLYKILKARILIQIGSSKVGRADKRLRQFVLDKLVKHRADVALFEQLKSEQNYNDHIQFMKKTFEDLGEKECVNEFLSKFEPGTTSEKYVLLRLLNNKLAWIKYEGSKQVTLEHPFLVYAKAKNANLNALRKQAFDLLEEDNIYLIGEHILRVFTMYRKETIQWVIAKHKTWPREKFSHVLQKLKAEFVKHPSYCELLKKELLECGGENIVTQLEVMVLSD